MSDPDDSRPTPDYVQNALEASCDALMTLESIRTVPAGDGSEPGAQLHVAQAIASLRHAISELRLAHDHDASMVGLGFVVKTVPGRPQNRRGRQARPRRTA